MSQLSQYVEKWLAGDLELAPITKLLGIRPISIGEGEARIELTGQPPDTLNWFGEFEGVLPDRQRSLPRDAKPSGGSAQNGRLVAVGGHHDGIFDAPRRWRSYPSLLRELGLPAPEIAGRNARQPGRRPFEHNGDLPQ